MTKHQDPNNGLAFTLPANQRINIDPINLQLPPNARGYKIMYAQGLPERKMDIRFPNTDDPTPHHKLQQHHHLSHHKQVPLLGHAAMPAALPAPHAAVHTAVPAHHVQPQPHHVAVHATPTPHVAPKHHAPRHPSPQKPQPIHQRNIDVAIMRPKLRTSPKRRSSVSPRPVQHNYVRHFQVAQPQRNIQIHIERPTEPHRNHHAKSKVEVPQRNVAIQIERPQPQRNIAIQIERPQPKPERNISIQIERNLQPKHETPRVVPVAKPHVPIAVPVKHVVLPPHPAPHPAEYPAPRPPVIAHAPPPPPPPPPPKPVVIVPPPTIPVVRPYMPSVLSAPIPAMPKPAPVPQVIPHQAPPAEEFADERAEGMGYSFHPGGQAAAHSTTNNNGYRSYYY